MVRYIIKRILIMIPTFLMVAILIFCVVNIIPGDPAAIVKGNDSIADIETIRARMGLDRSFLERLWDWFFKMLQGDLGDSYFLGRTVLEAIKERIPVTLSLATAALTVAVLVGVPLGIIASLKPNSVLDTAIMGVSLMGVSTPEFFLGLILMFVFAITLKLVPSSGYTPITEDIVGWAKHIILPALAFGLGQSAYIARLMRSSMLEVLNQDFIVTARAKGQSEFLIVVKHALQNAFLPILTAIGMIYALLLGGAFITESLFRIPGAGNLIISSIRKFDFPVVQGALLFVAAAILVVNLVVDILYAFVDPRVRFGSKK